MNRDTLAERLSLPRVHRGWLLVFAASFAMLYGTRAVLGPFIAGFIIAYLLDPLATKLMARWAAVGDRIGLHPVWMPFSVFAEAGLAGLTGAFLAVLPLA